MTADLKDLTIEEVAFVDKGAGKGVKVALFKRYNEEEETEKMKSLEEILGSLPEEDAAVVLQALEEASAAEAEAPEEDKEAAEGDSPEPEEEEETETSKAMKKSFDVLKAQNESLIARIAKMEEDKERETFVKRAEALPNVPGFSTEELGDFLLQVNKKLVPSMAEKTEAMIKSVNALLGDSSMINELGLTGASSSGNGSALAQAEAMASAAMSKDAKLTKAIALNQVWESNPELRNRYRMEKRGN